MSRKVIVGVVVSLSVGIIYGKTTATPLPETHFVKVPVPSVITKKETKEIVVHAGVPESCFEAIQANRKAFRMNWQAARTADNIKVRTEAINMHRVTDPQAIVEDVQYIDQQQKRLINIAAFQDQMLGDAEYYVELCQEERRK